MTSLIQRSFDDLGTSLFDVTFCVLDLETTGGSAADCEITEIGAVKVKGGDMLGEFQTLVNPGGPIPPFITILTGITHAMVVEAPPIAAVFPSLLEFIGDAVVVGHNVRFDRSFLDAAGMRLGYGKLPNRFVDTAGLARRLVRNEIRNLKLQSLAAHFRSPVTPNHRALEDARATTHVLWGLLERAGSLGVTALEDLLQLPTARGSNHYHKIHMARELPRSPGVYMFKDRHGEVIYVGKAKNLRTRVSSYFYGDERKSITNLLREAKDLDHIVCDTELEAAISEVRLIHAHRPRHNRRSRPPKTSHFVTLTNEAFPRLSLTRKLHTDARAVLGPFRSRRSADLVMNAIWDAVPVRRCTGKPGSRSGRCAPAQLGVAMCPCDGTLTHAEYQPVVDRIAGAIASEPALLLAPLAERMVGLAGEQRFEEAAWVRDRHLALSRAIERSRRWLSLLEAGRIELESLDGEHAVIDSGRFIASWRSGGQPPLMPPVAHSPSTPVPPTVQVAEEADLIWRWMSDRPVLLVDSERGFGLPVHRVPELKAG